jgi:hypothetical protein
VGNADRRADCQRADLDRVRDLFVVEAQAVPGMGMGLDDRGSRLFRSAGGGSLGLEKLPPRLPQRHLSTSTPRLRYTFPVTGFTFVAHMRACSAWSGAEVKIPGQVGERLIPADCKSAALKGYGGSNPPLSTRFAVKQAVVAQLVERVLGKDEVTSSILVNGSILPSS